MFMFTAATKTFGVSNSICDAMPTEKELAQNAMMEETLHQLGSFESLEETEKRMVVIANLNTVIKSWISELRDQRMTGEIGNDTGFLVPFGSYRLGVHSPGADIDTLVVAPRYVSRMDFFGSLHQRLTKDTNVSELHSVEDAFVPVMKMKYDGVEIDMLFAQLQLNDVPSNLDLSDDKLLINMDSQSVRSLNGYRVGEQLIASVPNPKSFQMALRAVKMWAKNQGVYSNVLGYFGGITWAILVARVCQLYPNAVPAKIVYKTFMVVSTWKWSCPITLNQITYNEQLPSLNALVWNPSSGRHLMPILTPAFPQQNTTFNVSESTKKIIISELTAGHGMCGKVFNNQAQWTDLFEKVNFFTKYKHFITLTTATTIEADSIAYTGFVESKIRWLIGSLERNCGINLAHINPTKYKPCKKVIMNYRYPEVTIWTIGLDIVAEKLDLTKEINNFKRDLAKWGRQCRSVGSEMKVEIDMEYVARSNLYKLLSKEDLLKGRKFVKPEVKSTDVLKRKADRTVLGTVNKMAKIV